MVFNLASRLLSDKRIRFVLCGGVSSAVYLAVQAFSVEILEHPVYIAATLAFVAGTATSFVMNSTFTFTTTMSVAIALRFAAVTMIGYLTGIAVTLALVSIGAHHLVAAMVVLAVVPILNFIGHAKITYRNTKP